MTSDIDKKDLSVDPLQDLSLKDWASFTPGQPLEDVQDPEEDQDEGEGEQGEGSGGGKHPRSLKAYRVELAQVLRFEEGISEEEKHESIWKKLFLLMLAPFSRLVPGGSGMATETDLGKKLFMGDIGIRNREIESHDIADPHLIRRLEERLRQRLERMGFSHADHAHALAPEGGFAPIVAMMPPKGKGDKPKKPKTDLQKDEEIRRKREGEEEEDSSDPAEGGENRYENAEKPASLSSSPVSSPVDPTGGASPQIGIPDLTQPVGPGSSQTESDLPVSEGTSPRRRHRHFEVGRTSLAEEFCLADQESTGTSAQTITLDRQLELVTSTGPEWALTKK